jgi:hypothetical protein
MTTPVDNLRLRSIFRDGDLLAASLAECRERFDELMQGSADWGSSGGGFFDIDDWEKEPPPDR